MGFFSKLRRSEQDGLKTLPGPGGIPVLGASPQLGKYANVWDGFSALNHKYGDLVGVQIGSRYCLVVRSAEYIREILVTKANQFSNRPDFARFHAIFRWNRDLSVALCDWSSKQKTRRDILYPPLHPKGGSCMQMKLCSAVEQQFGLLLDKLKDSNGVPGSPRDSLLRATGNIFYEAICSTTFDWSDPEFGKVADLYNEVFFELFQGYAIDFMPWLKPLYASRLQGLFQLAATVARFTAVMIEEHKRTYESYEDSPRDLLDILLLHLRNNKKDTSKDAIDHIDVDVIIDDLVGGFPVVTNMMMWGLTMIANEPDVQEKLFEEYQSVVGNGVPDMANRTELIYSEAVMYEVLRIVCSPIIPHVANEDTEIQGYRVPKDTMVMFNTCDLNFNPNHWDEPENFKPERFIQDGKILKPDFFLPFGTGKRSCMGDGFVRHIVYPGFSAIFGNFRVSLAPGTDPVDFLQARGKVLMDKEPQLVFESRN
ncbi:cytochrome P450 307a1 [Galendromus occidentalis]|uniref:Cytochrome P450 307a1 n=1 Tax=Galendromus occidentalis TaxID=34638 RepID=A0AAJ6QXL6_9ACAR|nr:cytochrome P450 307a1 [Galendromus occidentalis]